ncbi:acetamidase/formamidase family protein [candidate division KSB1 bacterium]
MLKKMVPVSILSLIMIFNCFCNQTEKGIPADAVIHNLAPSAETVAFGHYYAKTPPVLTISSGEYVNVQTLHVSNPRALERAGVPAEDIEAELIDVHENIPREERGPGGHVLTGPIYIEEADPGDVLEVRIISIDLQIPYSINSLSPRGGFLSGEFDRSKTKIIPLDEKTMTGEFDEGIIIPLKPFFGSMGVAPPEDAGKWNSSPPWIHGGNIDCKELVEGTSLFLPVHVKGALFQIGDGHAAQGNGEVCITALETSLKGTLQFIVHKDKSIEWPRAETDTHFLTFGMDENLTEATKIAVREMVKYLSEEKGMSRDDAYMLTSIAVDVNITQLVDGKKGVHAMLPKEIFVGTK